MVGSAPALRLGLLDAVPPEFYPAGEKSDPQKFVELFELVGAPFRYRTYAVTEGRFPASLDECDAYLITGSPCSVYDTYPWISELGNMIELVTAAAIPLVGICFGHQLIARTLGGTVRLADDGWLIGLHEMRVHRDKEWMSGQASTHPLYFINQDQVVELPPGVELLAGSEACPNAMFAIDDRVLSLQAHPEQPHASMRAFTNHLRDACHIDDSIAEAALQTMAKGEPDAHLVGRWITSFLLSAR